MLILRFSSKSGKFEISGVSGSSNPKRGTFRPPVDISFRDHLYTVRMDLPGVKPDEITIEASDREVHIYGLKEHVPMPGVCRLMECPAGTFKRTISFDSQIEPDNIHAEIENGVLLLTVPAPGTDRTPTRIEIKSTD